jgi:hypothetical protein
MTEINSLGSITGEQITEEQLLGLIAKCDVAIHNILFANGTFGALDIKEYGPAGFQSETSKLLQELRKTRELYMDLLTHPELRGDYAILISQWDDANL